MVTVEDHLESAQSVSGYLLRPERDFDVMAPCFTNKLSRKLADCLTELVFFLALSCEKRRKRKLSGMKAGSLCVS